MASFHHGAMKMGQHSRVSRYVEVEIMGVDSIPIKKKNTKWFHEINLTNSMINPSIDPFQWLHTYLMGKQGTDLAVVFCVNLYCMFLCFI